MLHHCSHPVQSALTNHCHQVSVEVAGGTKHSSSCDHFLGNSTISFTIEGCDRAYFEQLFNQTDKKEKWTVPAHTINVRVVDLVSSSGSRQQALKKLRTIVCTLRLENINELKEHTEVQSDGGELNNRNRNQSAEAGNEMKSAEDDSTTVRFQYDGFLVFEPVMSKIDGSQIDQVVGTNCSSYDMDFPTGSRSFHAVQYNENVKLEIGLAQLIIPDEDMRCNVVDETTKVTVLNGIGLSENNPTENRVIEELTAAAKTDEGKALQLALFTKCADTPCIQRVDVPNDDGSSAELPSSTVSLTLKVGIPNTVYSSSAEHPHSKQITINADGAVPHTMHVIVTGDLSDQPPRYVSFPIVKPFLILRKPA